MITLNNLLLVTICSINVCIAANNCHFQCGDHVVDLSTMKPTAGIFTVYVNNSAGVFFHPCYDVAIGKEQSSAALWLFEAKVPLLSNETLNAQNVLDNKVNGSFTAIASADSTECRFFEKDHIRYSLLYHHETAKNELKAEVLLACDDKPTPILELGSSQQVTFSLELIGKDACPLYKPPQSHLSGGSVFTIIFLTFSFIYFIGGGLILKYVRGAQGIEMIPNHEFWGQLPGLVFDGLKFAFTCGRSHGLAYERI